MGSLGKLLLLLDSMFRFIAIALVTTRFLIGWSVPG